MPRVFLRWLTAASLLLFIGAAGCGDDAVGVGADSGAGAGGGGMGGHAGAAGNGGMGGGAGGMAGSGGAGGMAGNGGSGGIDAPTIDAAPDAEIDASIDAAPDAYVPACGNGILDTSTGELCDTGIAQGNTGACPQSCPTSTNACVRIQLVNGG